MSYEKKLEDLFKQVAELKKSVDAKAENGAADPAKLDERMNSLLQKRLDAQKDAMIAEIRKGSYLPEDRNMTGEEEDMLFTKSADPKVRAFQKWNDDVVLLSSILKIHPSKLKTFQKFHKAEGLNDLKKAMDSATTNEGSEWIPTDFSSDLIDRVRLAVKVAGLFAQIAMPTDPYKLPAVKSDATAYLTSENTADTGTKITASTPGSRNVTLNAIKLAARILFSEELREDSIIPVLEFIKNQLAIAIAYGLEDALLNGDTAGTHMDSDVTSASDARKAWDGLRKLAQNANQVSLATFSTANLRSMRGKMGKYGVDPNKLAWIVSAKGYIKLLDLAEVVTIDKYGQNATILTGELAKLDGIPVVVSEKMRDDLNTTGVNDATSNVKGLVLLSYLPGCVLGNRRKLTVKQRMLEEEDQQVLVATWRGDFKPLFDETTENIVVEGVAVAV